MLLNLLQNRGIELNLGCDEKSLRNNQAAGNNPICFTELYKHFLRTIARLSNIRSVWKVPTMDRDFSVISAEIPQEVERAPQQWRLRDLDGPIEYDLSISHLNTLIHTPDDRIQRPSLWPLNDSYEAKDPEHIDDTAIRQGATVPVAELYAETMGHIFSNSDATGHIAYTADTPSATTFDSQSQARDSVLMTPELLELVLCFLPSPDLWKMTHVCQSWSELIKTSPTLRRCLGFSSTSAAAKPIHDYNKKDQFTVNPVLTSLNLISEDSSRSWCFTADFGFPARWRTVKAPWRDLQICERPIQRVFLTSSWLDKYIECDTGITAGQVADRVELSRKGALRAFHSG